MAMIKSGLNAFLVFLIVILIGGMIGISLFYQHTIKVANQKYNEKTQTLENTKNELQNQLNNLNSLNSSYENLSSDLQSYTVEFQTVYNICNNEKNLLAKELNKTTEDLQVRIVELQTIKQDSVLLLGKVSTLQAENNDMGESISNTDEELTSIRSKASSNMKKNLTESECRSVLSSINNNAEDGKDAIAAVKSSESSIKSLIAEIDIKIDSMIALLKRY